MPASGMQDGLGCGREARRRPWGCRRRRGERAKLGSTTPDPSVASSPLDRSLSGARHPIPILVPILREAPWTPPSDSQQMGASCERTWQPGVTRLQGPGRWQMGGGAGWHKGASQPGGRGPGTASASPLLSPGTSPLLLPLVFTLHLQLLEAPGEPCRFWAEAGMLGRGPRVGQEPGTRIF